MKPFNWDKALKITYAIFGLIYRLFCMVGAVISGWAMGLLVYGLTENRLFMWVSGMLQGLVTFGFMMFVLWVLKENWRFNKRIEAYEDEIRWPPKDGL